MYLPQAQELEQVRPEMGLLLNVLRPDLAQRPIPEPIDWPLVLRLAHFHGLVPMLYKALRQAPDQPVPSEFLQQLQERYQRIGRCNLALMGALLQILQQFARRGIDVLPLKGPVLAQTVYGELAIRPTRDLDLLVRPEALEEAVALLQEQGYQLPEGAGAPFRLGRQEMQHLDQIALSKAGQAFQITVELHWRLDKNRFGWNREAAPEFWRQLASTRISGCPVPIMPPEDLLNYLCVHGSRHRWERLIWIADVAVLMRQRADWDWAAINQRARKTGNQRRLGLGLAVASCIAGVELPEPVAQTLERDRPGRRLVRDTLRLLGQAAMAIEPRRDWAWLRYFMRLKPSLKYKVEMVLFVLRPGPSNGAASRPWGYIANLVKKATQRADGTTR